MTHVVTMPVNPALISAKEAARYAGRSERRIRELIATGEVESVYDQGSRLVRFESLNAWIDRLPTERAQ